MAAASPGTLGCMSSSKPGTALRATAVVLVILVLLVIAGEVAARWYAGKRVAEEWRTIQAEQGVVTEEVPDTSFGTEPLLWGALTSELGKVTIQSPSTLVVQDPAGQNGAPVTKGVPATTIGLTDLDISDADNPVAGKAEVTMDLPVELLQATANQEILARPPAGPLLGLLTQAARVTSLTAHPQQDHLTAQFVGGMLTVDFRPRAQAGDAVVDITGGSIAGFGADGFVQRVADAAIKGPIADLGTSMSIDSFEVTETALRVHLSGTGIAVRDLQHLADQAR